MSLTFEQQETLLQWRDDFKAAGPEKWSNYLSFDTEVKGCVIQQLAGTLGLELDKQFAVIQDPIGYDLVRALSDLLGTYLGIWNDRKERTWDEVAALLDSACELLVEETYDNAFRSESFSRV